MGMRVIARARSAARVVASAAIVMGLGATFSAPATANGADGQWYIDRYGIEDVHAQGVTGAGVTIAVVDTAIYLGLPELQGADVRVQEPALCYGPGGEARSAESDDPTIALHGTNVVTKIVGNGQGYDGRPGGIGTAPGATVLFYATLGGEECYTADGLDDAALQAQGDSWPTKAMSDAIIDATDRGADIISFSVGAPARDIVDAVAYALSRDVVIIAAVSNQDTDSLMDNLDGVPVDHNGVLGVNAYGSDGAVEQAKSGSPVRSRWVDVAAPGVGVFIQGNETDWTADEVRNGTSYAAPIVAGTIALAMQKYPQATHNQILQSLIHNTGLEPHDLVFDTEGQYGYGTVTTQLFLATDPTQYEDVNPLLLENFDEAAGWGPTIAQVAAAAGGTSAEPPVTASADPTAASVANGPDEPVGGSGLPLWPVVGGGVLVLIAAAGIVTAIVADTRTR